jgi:glycine/D-amino acid oxidase-like deaminating enzyme
MKIAVIGLGMLGAATARALALAGAEVTVFERVEPGAGTTSTSFAWVNSHQKDPVAYHALNVAGMAEHTSLGVAGEGGSHRAGTLEWSTDQGRLAATVATLRDRDYPVDWISPKRAVELVPDLLIPEGISDIAWYPTEGYVHPTLLLARLWGEARDRGASLRCPVTVTAIDEQPAGVRLTLDSGLTERFDTAVIAVGRWTEALAATAGLSIPMADPDEPASASVGLLAYTTPVPTRVACPLITPDLNVRPDGGGRLVLQALDLDVHADPGDIPPANGQLARQLGGRLRSLLAGTDHCRLTDIRVGQRAYPADGHTVAGHAGAGRLYVLATHSGITLGPLLGRLAAAELLSDRRDSLLEQFRPQRFIGVDRGQLVPLSPPRLSGQQ